MQSNLGEIYKANTRKGCAFVWCHWGWWVWVAQIFQSTRRAPLAEIKTSDEETSVSRHRVTCEFRSVPLRRSQKEQAGGKFSKQKFIKVSRIT